MNNKLILLIFIVISALSAQLGAARKSNTSEPEALVRDDFNKMSLETLMEGHYLPDFSYAGYRNGLDPLPKATGAIIHVRDFGATASDNYDDTKAVQAAIKAAHETPGRVTVRFDEGRYRVSGILKIERSDISLQGMGSGSDGTTLQVPRPLNQVDQTTALDELRKYIRTLNKRQVERDKNINEFFSEYSWSGGFIWIQKPGTRPAAYLEERDPKPEKLTDIVRGARGGATIEVADARSIERGDIVQIQWINSDGPDAGILKSLYGEYYKLAGSHHWSFPKRPLIRQTARVLRVEGSAVTLSDALLHNIDTDVPAQLSAWDGLVNVGIEDLHIEFPPAPHFGHHLEQGYNGIYFTSAFDSWVRSVRITNADNGILSYSSANLTYADVVTDGRRLAHYAVHLGNVHNVLVENVRVMNPVRHSLTFNTQATKCVYKNAEVFIAPTLDQHAGSNHQNLYDQVTLHVAARRSEEGPVAPVYDGSGAGYWQPGHGAYNTSWNLKILITGGAYPDETVTIQGLDEGPAARNIGLHGNRSFELDYRPEPYVRKLNEEVQFARSLYDYQLTQRLLNTTRPN